jgi:hypothetical protein
MLCRLRGSTIRRLDVEWMLLAGLGIMWAAFLVPWGRKKSTVFVALLELIVLSALIGIVPPLRQVWYVTAGLGGVLVLYVWVLLSIKGRVTMVRQPARPASAMHPVATPSFAVAAPLPDEGIFDFEDDAVHVVVREASVGV